MTVTACIVQARLGSTRLPAKVLLPLPTGRTVLEEVLHRCKRIPGVDAVVLAIPDTPENDIIEKVAPHGLRQVEWGIEIVRGPEHDVLARYAMAAEVVNADVIMRITSDCPLIDPKVCGRVLSAHKLDRADYASNTMSRTWPQGLDCQVFSRDLLRRADRETVGAGEVFNLLNHDRAHVCPWMERASDVRRSSVTCDRNRSHLRWTLDTLEDYVRIWRVFEEQMREAA